MEFQLANGENALGQPLLIVVDDAGRHIEEVLAIQPIGAGDAQFADGNAAEQAQLGGIQADADGVCESGRECG